jgi:hypothetical protein
MVRCTGTMKLPGLWAGPIEGKYGVLLLKGKVRVSGL